MKENPNTEKAIIKLKVRGHKQFQRGILINPVRWLVNLLILALLAGGGYAGYWYYQKLEQPRREKATSIANMEAVMKAIELYRTDNQGKFPPAYILDSHGDPTVGWRVLILPYFLDENGKEKYAQLYEEFDQTQAWNQKDNAMLLSRMPSEYLSPASSMTSVDGRTNYLAVVHSDSVFSPGIQCAEEDIKDPLNQTVAILEVADDSAIEWTRPSDFEFQPEVQEQSSPHFLFDGGLVCGMCDGSARFIEVGQNPRELFGKGTQPSVLAEKNPWLLYFLKSNGYDTTPGDGISNVPESEETPDPALPYVPGQPEKRESALD